MFRHADDPLPHAALTYLANQAGLQQSSTQQADTPQVKANPHGQPEPQVGEAATPRQQAFNPDKVTAQQHLQTTHNLLQNNPLTTNNTQHHSVTQASAPGVVSHSTSTSNEKNTANLQPAQRPAEPRPQEAGGDSRGSSRPTRGPRKDYAALAGVKK